MGRGSDRHLAAYLAVPLTSLILYHNRQRKGNIVDEKFAAALEQITDPEKRIQAIINYRQATSPVSVPPSRHPTHHPAGYRPGPHSLAQTVPASHLGVLNIDGHQSQRPRPSRLRLGRGLNPSTGLARCRFSQAAPARFGRHGRGVRRGGSSLHAISSASHLVKQRTAHLLWRAVPSQALNDFLESRGSGPVGTLAA